jgi:hypothetical protein
VQYACRALSQGHRINPKIFAIFAPRNQLPVRKRRKRRRRRRKRRRSERRKRKR